MASRNQPKSAFSLLEMLGVVVILGIIAALLVPRVAQSTDGAKERCCRHNCAQINGSTERYYIQNTFWPANDLSDIGADANFFPQGLPNCPVSGQLYRLDAVTHRVIGHSGPGDHSP